MTITSKAARLALRMTASTVAVAVITWIAFGLHAKAFIAGFLYLLLILPAAFAWGFVEATFASILAVICLDFFFTQPLFELYISDPQDWVALIAFELVVLTVSRLARKLRQQATETENQQANVDRLYAMSKELLKIGHKEEFCMQILQRIRQVFGPCDVAFWSEAKQKLYVHGDHKITIQELDATIAVHDDRHTRRYLRILTNDVERLGRLLIVSRIGIGRIDGRTADAIASLVMIAFDRERAFMAESQAVALRQSERLRSAILDGLAHTYKTPLATIQAASSGLLEIDRLDLVQKELVTTIEIQAQHLADLTTQMLHTAQLDAEQLKLRPQSIELQSFLAYDWSTYVQGLSEHRLEIRSNKAGETVWADPRLLKMTITQLLDNAAKYSEAGSPIELSVQNNGQETVFSVHNIGSYLSSEERVRIFERFYRAPESRNLAPGTGIGLTVSRQIAEAHHGYIWVESDPVAGTIFHLAIPHQMQEAS